MSHQHEGSAGIAVLAPVRTLAVAVEAARAGARLVDTGAGESLPADIRRAGLDLLICGHGDDADLGRDLAHAIRSGTGLICAGVAEAERAERRGVPRDRIVVQVTPGELTAADGWRTLVDVDDETATDPVARAGAVAAVCAWRGAAIISTRHVTQIRRCLDMTESIIGTRPPTWAVRGLA